MIPVRTNCERAWNGSGIPHQVAGPVSLLALFIFLVKIYVLLRPELKSTIGLIYFLLVPMFPTRSFHLKHLENNKSILNLFRLSLL